MTSIVITVLIFLFSSDYHKKQAVQGYLSPSVGVIKTYAPGLVYVDQVMVKEGDMVTLNQPLIRLKYKQNLASGLDMRLSIQHELDLQVKLLHDKEQSLNEVSASKYQETQQKILELDEQSRLLALQRQLSKNVSI